MITKFSDFVQINPKIDMEKGKEYEFVEMADVIPGNRYVYSKRKRELKGGSRFQSGDVLFARITPCLEHGKIPQFKSNSDKPAFGSTEFFVFRNIEDVSDQSYVYYLSLTDTIRKPAEKSMVGASGRQRANLDTIKNIEFDVPELLEQQKIASILSNYDDLIENNKKRIELLEKIAKLIYDEWFVRFKFPGHENVKMVDSEQGKIPEGWEVKSLYDVAEVLFGFALKSKLFCNDNSLKPIVRIRDIPKNKTETYSPEEIDEKYLIKNSDFLIGMDGIFHMCNWGGGNAYLNQRVARLRPLNDASKYYLFHAVKPNIERLNNEIVGTTVQHLSKGDFDRMKLIVPEEKIMRKFKEIVDPIYFEEIKLRLKNQNLRKTRDLLLPKLISGQVDISDLDIKVPEMQEVVV
jgi:type I restriction enzyme S subunit